MGVCPHMGQDAHHLGQNAHRRYIAQLQWSILSCIITYDNSNSIVNNT